MVSLVNINSSENWLAFLCGLLTVEMIMLIIFRKFANILGSTINQWYDNFGLVAIMLDLLSVLLVFWIAQWLYSIIFGNDKFELWKFILIFLGLQIIHDLLFYFIILKSSKGSNAILDFMLGYGNRHGGFTILGDSILVISAILIAYLYLNANLDFSGYMLILLLSTYLIGYLLYQKW